MTCDCPDCRDLADEMRANSEVLAALRHEPVPYRRPVRWRIAVAAAAVVLLGISLPSLQHKQQSPVKRAVAPPLKVKMLTPDPDVVIYWIIDPKENE